MRGPLLLHLVCAAAFAVPVAARAQSTDTIWVTVDGHRVHMLRHGGGGPTIVLEAGLGSTHRAWGNLPASLTGMGHVVSYDRPGHGRSEACPRPRTARVIAEELHDALAAAKLPPPYLLVGWSFGGSLVRVFAGMYPADVSGLVLVDPVSEDFDDRAERAHPDVFKRFAGEDSAGTASGSAGEKAEDAAWDSSMVQARETDVLLRAPTILLSSPRADLEVLGPIWTDEHRRWVARVPGARYVRVENVGHAIHRQRPDVVIDAIRTLLGRSPADPQRR